MVDRRVGRPAASRLDLRELRRPDDRRRAAELAARAMRDNPATFALYGDDPLARQAGIAVTWMAFFHGGQGTAVGAFYQGCLVGVAAATPPGACAGAVPGTHPAQLAEAPEPSAPPAQRAEYLQAVYAMHDGPQPHWHVGPVATEPLLHGLGIGTALLTELDRLTTGDGAPGWLETDTAQNVAFYAKRGWKPVAEFTALGCPMWTMCR